ncbi:hypothetical protein [Xanthomonas arboricola]|uniref:hypothetical protein n=1 Tax=Xanthomonas arboricola TaxID=56448 RepID=UPI00161F9FE1|nr:hypothetical protein [Xanthomonas arboricola]MBB4727666.1 hypothetical protein [Xanthomonas arboricola]
MKASRILFFLVLTLLTEPAIAHQDRILSLEPDGSIPEIPASFGKAFLVVEGLGTKAPVVKLKIGARSTALPLCMTRLIKTRQRSSIRLSGSWYHEERIVPFYINVEFPDPGQEQEKYPRSGQTFLFNLRTPSLTDSSSPEGCRTVSSALRPNNSFKPNLLRGSA